MKPIKNVTGVILAGGRSIRYGKNKALVKIEGISLIERVIGVMGPLFQNLIISTNTPDDYSHLNLSIQEDLIRGLGPLGGIHAALSVMPDEAGFFVACDMPFLNREFINHMVEVGQGFDAVVPRISWKLEALHAIYSKRCLPAIERLIESGECQIIRFFPEMSVRYVEEDEIRCFDPELRSFFNVNRPEELREYQRTHKQ